MNTERVTVNSVAEMGALAGRVAADIGGGELLLLRGGLGAGKTTFSQLLARALGVADVVTSPTFTLVSSYVVEGHPSIRTFVHADLYRLRAEEAQYEESIQEVLDEGGRADRVTVIEWSDRLGTLAPARGRTIRFAYGETDHSRVVTF